MSRAYNFCAGPATLPEPVMQRMHEELLEWRGERASVMEISHRCPAFEQLLKTCEQRLRTLLDVPDNMAVLFMHGGATAQFFALPMNLLGGNRKADYLLSGAWSKRAFKEAQNYGDIHRAAAIDSQAACCLSDTRSWKIRPESRYLYYTSNETFIGLQYPSPPESPIPLVSDMTSELLSRPIDFKRHGLVFAGAQKTMGIAGLAVVMVRRDWLDEAQSITPNMYRYATQDEAGSLCNTLPTFPVYVMNLMLAWAEEQGGVAALQQRCEARSAQLYGVLDRFPACYHPVVPTDVRSHMNVCFHLNSPKEEQAFLEGAEQRNLINLKGHASVGGVRASIYPQQTQEAVDALSHWMEAFALRKACV
jgi:phosphoserine aminotransferase